MSLFSSNRGRSSSRSPFSSFSLLVLAVATFLTMCVPSNFVAASKTKNRAILKEKYGIDCGTHCTNAVVKLHEAKIEQEKCVAFFFLARGSFFSFLSGRFVFVVVVVVLSFFLFREIRDRVFERRKRHRALLRADLGTICFRTLADERPLLFFCSIYLPRRQKTGD